MEKARLRAKEDGILLTKEKRLMQSLLSPFMRHCTKSLVLPSIPVPLRGRALYLLLRWMRKIEGRCGLKLLLEVFSETIDFVVRITRSGLGLE